MMRLIIIFLFPLCLVGQSIDDFRGLIGSWKREDVSKQKVSFEHWRFEDNAYYGHSYTHTEGKKTFEELMTITKKDNVIYYSVSTPGNDTVVHFRCRPQLLTDGFVFENPKHDFPTFIEYHLNNVSFHAIVGNDEFKIDFNFEKLNHDSISIMAVLSQMQLSYYLNDFKNIAMYYDDGAIIKGGTMLIKGREAIDKYWHTFQPGTWKLESDWIKLNSNQAEQRGRSTITYQNGSQDKVEFLLKWKKTDNQWLIVLDQYW